MTSTNNNVDTDSAGTPDKGVGCMSGSAPTYAEILKALDDLHIVCECATHPAVDEWYRCYAFAKEARQRAIDVLNRHAHAMHVHKYGPITMPSPNNSGQTRPAKSL